MVSVRTALLFEFFVWSLIFSFASNSTAADKPAGYKRGDHVEVGKDGQWFGAVVLAVDKNTGQIQAQIEEIPEQLKGLPPALYADLLKVIVPPEQVRRPLKKPNGNKPSAKGGAADRDDAATKPVLRTWKDRTGKFNLKATFQGQSDGKVVLLTEQGKRIEVALEKLSDADARYVKRQPAAKEENPFAALVDEDSDTSSAAPTLKALTPDRTHVKVFARKSLNQWAFQPKVQPIVLNSKAFGKRVTLNDLPDSHTGPGNFPNPLPPLGDFAEFPKMSRMFEQPLGLYLTNDGGQAVVARQMGFEHEGRRYLQPVEFTAQIAGPLMPLPEKCLILDVSTQENLVAYCTDEWGHRSSGATLTIARPEGKQLIPMSTWATTIDSSYLSTFPSYNALSIAWFLPGRRLMLFDQSDHGWMIWNVDTAQALFNVPTLAPSMALTVDRQYMALPTPGSVALIDLLAGEHVASLPLVTDEKWRSFAFSDDNRRLVGLCERGIFVWDLTTGKLLREFWHQTMANALTMRFAGDFVLLDEQFLYDAERRILLWEYSDRPEAMTTVRNGRMWAVLRGSDRTQPTSVVTAKVPHSKAIETAKGLGTPEELLIAKPGDLVAIKIDIDPSIVPADEVRTAIAANLVAAGFKVANQADLVLTAVCRRKDSQTIKLVPGFGRILVNPAEILEKNITPHASYVTLTYRGEKVFDQGYLATPGSVIHLQSGENLDQALLRLTSPNIAMIKTTRYASYIARAGTASANGAYGTSRFAVDE